MTAFLLLSGFSGVLVETREFSEYDAPGGELSGDQAEPAEQTEEFLQEKVKVQQSLASMEGWFTENRGQLTNNDIKFIYSGSTCSLGFKESGYLIKLVDEEDTISLVEVEFLGARSVLPRGSEEMEHRSNYFRGNDPSRWQREVPNFQKLIYEELYPGIDLVFSTTESGLKYDFLVSPGADPDQISWRYEGAEDIFIDEYQRLRVVIGDVEFVEEAPYSYQNPDGAKQVVDSRYLVEDATVGFIFGDYDPSEPLIVDPLIYSTFIGGYDKDDGDGGDDLAMDSKGNVFVTGYAGSENFPTTEGAYSRTHSGGEPLNSYDVFVLKLSVDGSKLLYSTFVGGDQYDRGYSICVDSDGNAYVSGIAGSSDFATTAGAYDTSHDGSGDIFVLKLNSDGSDLVYSTFLGGSDWEESKSIILDSNNNACILGYSGSSDFPTTSGAYDRTHNGKLDIVISKLNSDGSNLIYSTFIGGDGSDYAEDFTQDENNDLYVLASVRSANFPTTSGAYDETYNGGDGDVAVFKLSSDASDLEYSTFVGGTDYDWGESLHLSEDGTTYITGKTKSTDFPVTSGVYDETYNGQDEIIVFKLSADGRSLEASSFVGGEKKDEGRGIAQGPGNNLFLVGNTVSSDFPTTVDALDRSFNGRCDIVLFMMTPDLTSLEYSTFIGGSEVDGSHAFQVAKNGLVSICGATNSEDLVTTSGAYDETHNGKDDVFVMMFSLKVAALIEDVSPSPAITGHPVHFTGAGIGGGEIDRYVWRSSLDGDLYNDTGSEFTHDDLSLGQHEIYLKVRNSSGVWSEEASTILIIHERPEATIEEISPDVALKDQQVIFTGSGSDDDAIVRYAWRAGDDEIYNGSEPLFGYNALETGEHTIYFKVQDEHGAWSEENSTTLTVHSRPVAHIAKLAPRTPVVGETVDFKGRGSDDGSIQRCVWVSSLDGELHNDTEGNFESSELRYGNHTITFRVQDDLGAWSEELSHWVLIHNSPTAEIVSIFPETPFESRNCSFMGKGSDDGTVVRYAWRVDDKEFYNGTEAEIIYDGLVTGDHTIYFKVRDGDGAWSSEQSTLLQVYIYPLAVIDDLSSQTVAVGDEVSFKGHGITGGSTQRYVWNSSLDGELHNDTEGDFSSSHLRFGNHIITFRVQDDRGVWSKEVSSWVLVKTRPIAEIVSIVPEIPANGDTIIFVGNGSDDGEITRYVWRVGDNEIYNGTQPLLRYTGLEAGNYTIFFKVRDGDGAWSTELSTILKVQSRPTAEMISITPRSPTDIDTVFFVGNGSDDGTVVRYIWRVDDMEIYNGTEKEFNYTGLPRGENRLYLKVQDDHGAWSDEVFTTFIVKKYYPPNMIPILNISSPVNYSEHTGTVIINGTASDLDGTIVRVVFSLDNGDWKEATGTTSWSLAWESDDVADGEHTLRFRAYDGRGYSEVHTLILNTSNMIAITEPISGSPVSGTITIEGEATRYPINDDNATVHIRIDDGVWKTVNDKAIYAGTCFWQYEWNSRAVANGTHTISSKAFNGTVWSSVVSVEINVTNAGGQAELVPSPIWVKDQSWTWKYSMELVGTVSTFTVFEAVVGINVTENDLGEDLGAPCYKIEARMDAKGFPSTTTTVWLDMASFEIRDQEGSGALFLYEFFSLLDWPLVITEGGSYEWSDAGIITVEEGTYHCYRFEGASDSIYYAPDVGHFVKVEMGDSTYELKARDEKPKKPSSGDDDLSIPGLASYMSMGCCSGVMILIIGGILVVGILEWKDNKKPRRARPRTYQGRPAPGLKPPGRLPPGSPQHQGLTAPLPQDSSPTTGSLLPAPSPPQPQQPGVPQPQVSSPTTGSLPPVPPPPQPQQPGVPQPQDSSSTTGSLPPAPPPQPHLPVAPLPQDSPSASGPKPPVPPQVQEPVASQESESSPAKGMWKCSNCGGEIMESFMFCVRCGNKR